MQDLQPTGVVIQALVEKQARGLYGGCICTKDASVLLSLPWYVLKSRATQ